MSMFRFYNTVQDTYGNSKRGTVVYIYTAGTGVVATLYENDETTTKSNPITTDNTGLVDFKIPAGNYDFRYVSGDIDRTISDIFLGANDNALNSEEWATNPEDNLISTGAGGDGSTDYSSLHWAAKASASAIAAALSETNASASETAALAAVGAVKITATDTTASTLDSSVLVSSELTKTVNNPAANETLTFSLTDAGVTLGKLANLTAGGVIVGNASNRPSASAVGTAGQVLTSGGVGVAPTMQDAGGGAWVLISSATAAASTSVEFIGNFPATYDTYMVVGEGVNHSVNSANHLMELRLNSDSLWYGGTTSLRGLQYGTTEVNLSSTDGKINPAAVYWDSSNQRSLNFSIKLNNPLKEGNLFIARLELEYFSGASASATTSYGNWSKYVPTSDFFDGVRFKPSSGNIAAGNFTLYGLKKS